MRCFTSLLIVNQLIAMRALKFEMEENFNEMLQQR